MPTLCFGLLLHGKQKSGSKAATALKLLGGVGSYGKDGHKFKKDIVKKSNRKLAA